ncbi:MAG: hypothetical protein Q9195_009628 [Heterodermia aff. obscurata]
MTRLAAFRPGSGPLSAPLYACPTPPERLTFPTYWYRLPNDDNFLICTKCYEDKLRSTPFADVLRYDHLDFGPGSSATCDFNTPRIDSLLRNAIASNNFQPLLSFTEQRLSIKPCAGTQGIKGGNGVKWFKPSNDEIPGFVCCEACHEDVVLDTNFEPRFSPYWEQQPADQTWSCDLAIPYLRRSLPQFAWTGDWYGFVQACRRRMSLPECARGVSAVAIQKTWFNTVRPSPIPDMTICEACYLDRAGWQVDAAPNFAPISFDIHQYSTQLLCDFSIAPMAACADILLVHGMFAKWHHFATLTAGKPRCDPEGIVDGEWYGLPDPTDPTRNIENFDICAACHAGWNQSADWGHLFRRWTYPPSTSRLCDFNPSAPAYADYLDKWNQMYFTRDPAPFIDYVSRFASLSKCQGTKQLEHAAWYGDTAASLLICPRCFEEAVRGTYFASAFALQKTQLPGAHHCSLYSPRMRKKYAEACEQQSLDALFNFATEREHIYQQTMPQIEAFLASQQQKMEMLKIAGQHRANSVGALSTYNAFTGGNPIVSGFSPGIVLSTLSYRQQLRDLEFDPQRPTMMQLEAKWKEVE